MGNMKNILVTGANGQLGNELRESANSHPSLKFYFTDKEELAIDDGSAIEKFFLENKISYCINCAAYTAVDNAESEKENAYALNATAVGHLASTCKKYNAWLIHISTDYVFNGSGNIPYTEDDDTDPVNYYGITKRDGEKLAMQANPQTIIIRTSWLYSSYGNNFVKTMIRLFNEKKSIDVVNDQFGSPTYAADLASAILHIIEGNTGKGGIYHYSNTGIISWYAFALAIKEKLQKQCIINPVPTTSFPTRAKRPAYSAFETNRIFQQFGITAPGWKESLAKCLEKIEQVN